MKSITMAGANAARGLLHFGHTWNQRIDDARLQACISRYSKGVVRVSKEGKPLDEAGRHPASRFARAKRSFALPQRVGKPACREWGQRYLAYSLQHPSTVH